MTPRPIFLVGLFCALLFFVSSVDAAEFRYRVNTFGGWVEFVASGQDCVSVSHALLPIVNIVYGSSSPYTIGGCSGDLITIGANSTVSVVDSAFNGADLTVQRLAPAGLGLTSFEAFDVLIVGVIAACYALGFIAGQQR